MSDPRRVLATHLSELLQDGHSFVETHRVSFGSFTIEMSAGVIHYFHQGNEYSAGDIIDLLDDHLN